MEEDQHNIYPITPKHVICLREYSFENVICIPSGVQKEFFGGMFLHQSLVDMHLYHTSSRILDMKPYLKLKLTTTEPIWEDLSYRHK